MYKAINGGSATGQSGRLYRFSAGKEVQGNPEKGELDHCKSVIWVTGEVKQEPDHSTNYTISELRDMDLSDKEDAFFEGDDRETINKLK